jgi:hypothetical protein
MDLQNIEEPDHGEQWMNMRKADESTWFHKWTHLSLTRYSTSLCLLDTPFEHRMNLTLYQKTWEEC